MQQPHMSIVIVFNILFSLQVIFSNKDRLARQVTLRTIMNTKLYIWSKRPFHIPPGYLRGFLNIIRVFICESKILQALLPKRKRTTLNKESSRERMGKKTQGQMILCGPFLTLEKECLDYLRKNENIYHILIVEYTLVDSYQTSLSIIFYKGFNKWESYMMRMCLP